MTDQVNQPSQLLGRHPPTRSPHKRHSLATQNRILRFANETFERDNAVAQVFVHCPLRMTFAI